MKKKILAVLILVIIGAVVVFGYNLYTQDQEKKNTDKARQAINEVLKDHPELSNPCFGGSVLGSDDTVNDAAVKGKSIEEIKAYIIQKESGFSDC